MKSLSRKRLRDEQRGVTVIPPVLPGAPTTCRKTSPFYHSYLDHVFSPSTENSTTSTNCRDQTDMTRAVTYSSWSIYSTASFLACQSTLLFQITCDSPKHTSSSFERATSRIAFAATCSRVASLRLSARPCASGLSESNFPLFGVETFVVDPSSRYTLEAQMLHGLQSVHTTNDVLVFFVHRSTVIAKDKSC